MFEILDCHSYDPMKFNGVGKNKEAGTTLSIEQKIWCITGCTEVWRLFDRQNSKKRKTKVQKLNEALHMVRFEHWKVWPRLNRGWKMESL